MKFVAVLILAIAVYANASVVPLAYSSWGPSLTVSQPLTYAVPAAVPITYSAPAAHVYAAPAPVAVFDGTEGQYVAANRGSVHVAPLPGHAASATSINLDAAPGTW